MDIIKDTRDRVGKEMKTLEGLYTSEGQVIDRNKENVNPRNRRNQGRMG